MTANLFTELEHNLCALLILYILFFFPISLYYYTFSIKCVCCFSTEHLTASYPGSARNSAAGSLASSRESSASQGPAPYKVLMLGAPAVGKSSIVSQFMTSEYLHAYDTSIGEIKQNFYLLEKKQKKIINCSEKMC